MPHFFGQRSLFPNTKLMHENKSLKSLQCLRSVNNNATLLSSPSLNIMSAAGPEPSTSSRSIISPPEDETAKNCLIHNNNSSSSSSNNNNKNNSESIFANDPDLEIQVMILFLERTRSKKKRRESIASTVRTSNCTCTSTSRTMEHPHTAGVFRWSAYPRLEEVLVENIDLFFRYCRLPLLSNQEEAFLDDLVQKIHAVAEREGYVLAFVCGRSLKARIVGYYSNLRQEFHRNTNMMENSPESSNLLQRCIELARFQRRSQLHEETLMLQQLAMSPDEKFALTPEPPPPPALVSSESSSSTHTNLLNKREPEPFRKSHRAHRLSLKAIEANETLKAIEANETTDNDQPPLRKKQKISPTTSRIRKEPNAGIGAQKRPAHQEEGGTLKLNRKRCLGTIGVSAEPPRICSRNPPAVLSNSIDRFREELLEATRVRLSRSASTAHASACLSKGRFLSVVKFCQLKLALLYREASDLLKALPDSAEALKTTRTQMSDMWCCYANVLLVLGNSLSSGTIQPEGGEPDMLPSPNWSDQAIFALSAAISCPLSGNHSPIAISLARITIARSLNQEHSTSTENTMRAVRMGISLCFDGVDRAHASVGRMRLEPRDAGLKKLLLVAQCHDRVTELQTTEPQETFRTVLTLPSLLNVKGTPYVFLDTGSAAAFCKEANRLSKLQQKLDNFCGVLLSPMASGLGDIPAMDCTEAQAKMRTYVCPRVRMQPLESLVKMLPRHVDQPSSSRDAVAYYDVVTFVGKKPASGVVGKADTSTVPLKSEFGPLFPETMAALLDNEPDEITASQIEFACCQSVHSTDVDVVSSLSDEVDPLI